MFPTSSGAFFECSPDEASKAFLHRFAAAGAAVRYRAMHRDEIEDSKLHLALAKLYEHAERSFDKALDVVGRGTSEAAPAREKRRARLVRKLESTVTDRDKLSPLDSPKTGSATSAGDVEGAAPHLVAGRLVDQRVEEVRRVVEVPEGIEFAAHLRIGVGDQPRQGAQGITGVLHAALLQTDDWMGMVRRFFWPNMLVSLAPSRSSNQLVSCNSRRR